MEILQSDIRFLFLLPLKRDDPGKNNKNYHEMGLE